MQVSEVNQQSVTYFVRKSSFWEHVITRYGISTDPDKINTVRKWSVPTSAREVQQFLGLVGYYRRYIQDFTTPCHPQSDGLVECFNRTLISMLATTVPIDWESHIKKVFMAYNTSVHFSTGFSPFYT